MAAQFNLLIDVTGEALDDRVRGAIAAGFSKAAKNHLPNIDKVHTNYRMFNEDNYYIPTGDGRAVSLRQIREQTGHEPTVHSLFRVVVAGVPATVNDTGRFRDAVRQVVSGYAQVDLTDVTVNIYPR